MSDIALPEEVLEYLPAIATPIYSMADELIGICFDPLPRTGEDHPVAAGVDGVAQDIANIEVEPGAIGEGSKLIADSHRARPLERQQGRFFAFIKRADDVVDHQPLGHAEDSITAPDAAAQGVGA